jgi:hypothetical protein
MTLGSVRNEMALRMSSCLSVMFTKKDEIGNGGERLCLVQWSDFCEWGYETLTIAVY